MWSRHDLVFKTTWFKKDGIGRVAACSDRLTRRVWHAYFYPELEPSPRYPVPLERLEEVLGAGSPAEVIRRLQPGEG